MSDKSHRPVVDKVEAEKAVVAEHIDQIVIHEGTKSVFPADTLGFIKKLLGWTTGFVAFITAIVGFIKLWQGDAGLVTIVLLAVGAGGGTLGCAYLAFSRTERQRCKPEEGRKEVFWEYNYPRWRPWALVGLVIIPLLAVSEVGYYVYQNAQPTDEIVILIADFDGPEPQKYRVTETVLNRLRVALAEYEDVEIKALGRAITEVEGSTVAKAEGESYKATIVIWGWYGVTNEAVSLSVHFEVLRSVQHADELMPETAEGFVQIASVGQLESFTLQTQLSEEMVYLSLCSVGMTSYTTGEWKQAVNSFSKALNLSIESAFVSNRSKVYFYRGLAYSGIGDRERATEDFERSVFEYDQTIQRDPDNAKAWVSRGIVYLGKREYALAIRDFSQAIHLDSASVDAHSNRGFAYLREGDYGQAISDFDQALTLEPDQSQAFAIYPFRGIAYVGKADYQRAIADFDYAIQLQPDVASTYINRGFAYLESGKLDDALRDYNLAVNLDAENPAAHFGLGLVYGATGDYERAILDFDRAMELLPNYPMTYLSRGYVYLTRGFACFARGDYDQARIDRDQAMELANQAIELEPDNSTAYMIRGNVYSVRGDYERATLDFDRVIKLKPDYADAYLQRGGNFVQAFVSQEEVLASDLTSVLVISDFDRAIQLRPNYAEAYLGRGTAYHFIQGDLDKAIADYDQAIALQPRQFNAYHDFQTYRNRGLAYQSKVSRYTMCYGGAVLGISCTGDINVHKAIEDLNRALKLSKDPNHQQQLKDMIRQMRFYRYLGDWESSGTEVPLGAWILGWSLGMGTGILGTGIALNTWVLFMKFLFLRQGVPISHDRRRRG